jgi:hypothetical protein
MYVWCMYVYVCMSVSVCSSICMHMCVYLCMCVYVSRRFEGSLFVFYPCTNTCHAHMHDTYMPSSWLTMDVHTQKVTQTYIHTYIDRYKPTYTWVWVPQPFAGSPLSALSLAWWLLRCLLVPYHVLYSCACMNVFMPDLFAYAYAYIPT